MLSSSVALSNRFTFLRRMKGISKQASSPAISQLSPEEKMNALTQWGTQSNSYFHLQRELSHFGKPNLGFISFVPYKDVLGTIHLTFSKPVCSSRNLNALLDAYHQEIDSPTIFAGVNQETADNLSGRGYKVNDIGSEYTIPTMTFKTAGKSQRWLRRIGNMGKKGIVVKEQSWAEVDAKQVKAISEAWRSTKKIKQRELKFMTRPPYFGDEWGVRKFYAYRGDELLGYLFCDPYFKDGKTLGYTGNITRSKPGIKPAGVQDFLVLEVLKILRNEGVPFYALGLSPLHSIERTEDENILMRWGLHGLYEYGSSLYDFKSLGFHKQRFKVPGEKSYAAIRGISPLRSTLATLRTTNVI